MHEEPTSDIRHRKKGVSAIGKLEGDDRVRGAVTEQHLEKSREPAYDELRGALTAAYGTDYGVRNVTWVSRFTDAAQQAEPYRMGRMLLEGDGAHIYHRPVDRG